MFNGKPQRVVLIAAVVGAKVTALALSIILLGGFLEVDAWYQWWPHSTAYWGSPCGAATPTNVGLYETTLAHPGVWHERRYLGSTTLGAIRIGMDTPKALLHVTKECEP